MSTADEDDDMRVQIAELFNTGALSDLTITCGGQRFHVHKVVLYIQSKYFRKLLGGPFKEARASTINLPDDDPYVLRALVRYLYKNVLDTSQAFSFPPYQTLSDSAFLIHVYAIADKYDVPALCRLVVQRLVETCDPQKDEADFIEALRVVDDCTLDNEIWDFLLTKTRKNLQTLLKNGSFRELVLEHARLTFELLDSYASVICAR